MESAIEQAGVVVRATVEDDPSGDVLADLSQEYIDMNGVVATRGRAGVLSVYIERGASEQAVSAVEAQLRNESGLTGVRVEQQ